MLAITQALTDLHHRTPSFYRDEAFRGGDGEVLREIVTDILTFEGDSRAPRLLRDLLSAKRGGLTIRDR